MKKLYTNLNRYLWHKNTEDGESGSGGDAPIGESAATPDSALPDKAPATPEEPAAPDAWKAGLPADLQDKEEVKKATSLEDLVKGIVSKPASEPDQPKPLTLPETVTGSLAEKVLAYAGSKEYKQEDLDGLIALKTDLDTEAATARMDGFKEGQKALYANWSEGVEPDAVKPLITENLNLANRALDHLDKQCQLGLKDYLGSAESGFAGQDPKIIEMFFKMGAVFKESGFLKSEANPPKAQPTGKQAHLMYPNDAPKQ